MADLLIDDLDDLDAQGTRHKAQGARRKAQGAGRKAQGARHKAQGARRKAQGARHKAQGAVRKAQGARHKAQGAGRKAAMALPGASRRSESHWDRRAKGAIRPGAVTGEVSEKQPLRRRRQCQCYPQVSAPSAPATANGARNAG